MSDASLIRLPRVEEITGLSRSSIYRLERLGKFPRRIQLSERATAWRIQQIIEWCEGRPQAAPSTTQAAAA